MIGTNAAKDTLLGRLAMLPTQQRPEERWWHLPADLPDSWFEQMAAERKDPETDCWVPVKANVRNEAIDVSVYAGGGPSPQSTAAGHPARARLVCTRRADPAAHRRPVFCSAGLDTHPTRQKTGNPSATVCPPPRGGRCERLVVDMSLDPGR